MADDQSEGRTSAHRGKYEMFQLPTLWLNTPFPPLRNVFLWITVSYSHRLQRMKSANGRLTRWALTLQPYHFRVEYHKGTDNGNADGLSRGPLDPQLSSIKEGGM